MWLNCFLAASPIILAAAIAAAEHNMKKKESGPPRIIQFLMQWECVPVSVVCNTMSPQIFRCTFHMTMTFCGICTLFCQNILRQLLKVRGTISAREREHLSQSSNLLFCWCISIQYCLYFGIAYSEVLSLLLKLLINNLNLQFLILIYWRSRGRLLPDLRPLVQQVSGTVQGQFGHWNQLSRKQGGLELIKRNIFVAISTNLDWIVRLLQIAKVVFLIFQSSVGRHYQIVLLLRQASCTHVLRMVWWRRMLTMKGLFCLEIMLAWIPPTWQPHIPMLQATQIEWQKTIIISFIPNCVFEWSVLSGFWQRWGLLCMAIPKNIGVSKIVALVIAQAKMHNFCISELNVCKQLPVTYYKDGFTWWM